MEIFTTVVYFKKICAKQFERERLTHMGSVQFFLPHLYSMLALVQAPSVNPPYCVRAQFGSHSPDSNWSNPLLLSY
jgi:hypothetical protein